MGTPIENVIVVPDDSNVLKWEVTMNGPVSATSEQRR
jgi:hypothetical protein